MTGRSKALDLSPEEFAIIESALQTQSKILNVQAKAGASKARERLNAVKNVLTRLAQQRPTSQAKSPKCTVSFFGMSRIFG